MERTFEDILKEVEERMRLKTSLKARDIPLVEDATTAWLRNAVKTAPFDERFDWYGVGSVVRCNECRGVVTRVIENNGLRDVRIYTGLTYRTVVANINDLMSWKEEI